jgi:succinate dehydrogenase/fumarate reductase flavoprotein subunit
MASHSEGQSQPRVAVIGGGLAGLAAAVRIAESGMAVDLFSMVPVKRSHSVCAQGGINACNEVARQQGYSEYQHFDETIYGGDYLADQGPVLEMANWAPKIIDLLDRMGVPFNRTGEGNRDLRLFGGSLFKRTHFAGATTGQQLLYALDEQTRRFEAEGLIKKYEFWEFLWPVMTQTATAGKTESDRKAPTKQAVAAVDRPSGPPGPPAGWTGRHGCGAWDRRGRGRPPGWGQPPGPARSMARLQAADDTGG